MTLSDADRSIDDDVNQQVYVLIPEEESASARMSLWMSSEAVTSGICHSAYSIRYTAYGIRLWLAGWLSGWLAGRSA